MSETECVLVPRDLVAFLLGEDAHDGLWFNEAKTINGRAHPFWWRTNLRACVAASPVPAASRGNQHTVLMNAISGDLVRQFPEAFFEEGGVVVLDTEGNRFLSVDVSALAEAALPDAPVPAKDGEGEG